MRALTAHEIRGTYATLLLPVREDDSIDFEELERQIAYYLDAGVDGIYSNGTAGEFYSLTREEFLRISRMLADACERNATPFQIGAAWPTPQESLERISWAVQFAPSAIQVILPDWWPPTIEESVAYLRHASRVAGSVPLILYNPPHAKRVLSPKELLIVRREIPSLIGIKTAAGDDAWYHAMEPLLGEISVFVPGHTLASGIARGASGSYSNVACLQPRGAVRWSGLIRKNLLEALEWENAIQRFMTESILPFREQHGHSNMALDKLLAWIGGWSGLSTRLRWPYIGISLSNLEELRERAHRNMPFIFEEE